MKRKNQPKKLISVNDKKLYKNKMYHNVINNTEDVLLS